MKNAEIDVSDGAKRMRRDSSARYMDQIGPGTSGLVRELSLKNGFAMMLDSSSEDESQETPENVSVEAIWKSQLLSYRNKKSTNVDDNPIKRWSVHREEMKLLTTIPTTQIFIYATSLVNNCSVALA